MNRWLRIRRAGGITQYELGDRAKVSRAKIANVESGRGEYTPEELSRIAAVLLDAISTNVDEVNKLLTVPNRK